MVAIYTISKIHILSQIRFQTIGVQLRGGRKFEFFLFLSSSLLLNSLAPRNGQFLYPGAEGRSLLNCLSSLSLLALSAGFLFPLGRYRVCGRR